MATVSISEFLNIIKTEQKDFDKNLKRVVFNIVTDVQYTAIRNVDKLLNKNGNKGLKRAGSKGGLRNSIKLKTDSRTKLPFVEAGQGLSYAAIHEFGGIIKPTLKQWLTIPAIPENAGMTADQVANSLGGNSKLAFRMVNPSLAMLFQPLSKGQIKVHFWLKKQVVIPQRSYLRSAGKTIMADQTKYVNAIFGASHTPWKVAG